MLLNGITNFFIKPTIFSRLSSGVDGEQASLVRVIDKEVVMNESRNSQYWTPWSQSFIERYFTKSQHSRFRLSLDWKIFSKLFSWLFLFCSKLFSSQILIDFQSLRSRRWVEGKSYFFSSIDFDIFTAR